MNIEPLIVKKRDGRALSDHEIHAVVSGYTAGEVVDYQMSALRMAILLQGMDFEETVSLTRAIVETGVTLDLSGISRPTVDKHSTGGVGDTATLVLAPLLAAMGFAVPKLSGRGLGFTGGTLDKLESIPGFRIDLTSGELIGQCDRIGVAIAAQSADLVPADRVLYALRDVTGTVPSIPLIASSILSKKIAGGARTIVLDVKVGDGAFMKDVTAAQELSEIMVSVGRMLGREVVTVLSRMDEPLSQAVGNALEVRHAIDVLAAREQGALYELSIYLAAVAGHAADASISIDDWRERAVNRLEDGSALESLRRLIEAQGGDTRVVDDTDLLGWAEHTDILRAPTTGYVHSISALGVGETARLLGAGRASLDDDIDPLAGVTLDVRVGSRVERGDRFATLHASDGSRLASGLERLAASIVIGADPAPHPEFVTGRFDILT